MNKIGTFEDFRKFAISNTNVKPTILDDTIKNTNNIATPYVLEERQLNVATYDIFSRMLLDRIVFLSGEVSNDSMDILIAQMLYLNSVDNRDIGLYVNSPGGDVLAGLSLIDTINYVEPDVATTCLGMAASMGAVLLSCGAKGKRFVLPHSRVMIHQVSSGARGVLKDLEIELEQTRRCKQDLYKILSENCNKTFEEIERDCDRNFWLIGNEAVEYGIADTVLTKKN